MFDLESAAHNDFYPRPRVEGDKTWYTNNKDVANFYPRPRVEGDGMVEWVTKYWLISTHALA